jgi:hypothetical protein
MSKKYYIFTIFVILFFISFTYETKSQENILAWPSLREQAKIQQEWVKKRLENILPKIMRENDIQMWIIITREHNPDPAYSSIVSPTTLYVRRRSIFVFYDAGINKGVEKYAVITGNQDGLFMGYSDTSLHCERDQKQWLSLKKLITDKNPKNISVNMSNTFEFSEGLLACEWNLMNEKLGPEIMKKIKPAERIPLDYIETRLPEMIPYWKSLQIICRNIIKDAFSNKTITIGKTTATDIVWWFREEAQKKGFIAWFHPTVDILRMKTQNDDKSEIIKRGDILHCDFGIKGMNLNTDVQYLAYVLKEDENDAPKGLKQALANTNRLQDIVIKNMKIGLTGDQILNNSLNQMKKEGLRGAVYSHPIGEHGHGAGTLIGLWDKQDGVPGKGDVPLLPNSWYSIELHTLTKIPEWNNQEIGIGQEEDVMINNEGKVEWILDRQSEFILIK